VKRVQPVCSAGTAWRLELHFRRRRQTHSAGQSSSAHTAAQTLAFVTGSKLEIEVVTVPSLLQICSASPQSEHRVDSRVQPRAAPDKRWFYELFARACLLLETSGCGMLCSAGAISQQAGSEPPRCNHDRAMTGDGTDHTKMHLPSSDIPNLACRCCAPRWLRTEGPPAQPGCQPGSSPAPSEPGGPMRRVRQCRRQFKCPRVFVDPRFSALHRSVPASSRTRSVNGRPWCRTWRRWRR
jgi:hypothetical protein